MGETQPIEIDITALAAGGDGVGRMDDGRVVFVPFTAPGDRVRVRVVERKPRYLRGEVAELLTPGAARVDPVCPVFGSCGGCAWQHVDYAAQLEAKARIVRDALTRLAKLTPPEFEIEPSPAAYAYRGRTRVVRRGGRVGYRRRRSHVVTPVSRCPVLQAPVEAELRSLAGDASAKDGEWELASGVDGTRRVRLGRDPGHAGLELRVGPDALRVSPGVFFQSNALLLETLCRAVVEAAGNGAIAYDLFAGAGFLTLGLARRFDRVVALEGQPAAAADLAHNARRNAVEGIEVVEASMEAALDDGRLAPRPDAIVLDPPRTGLPRDVSGPLARLGAARIVYLSCDPATLARDLAPLMAEGYGLAGVRAFDLFPQTPHVETLVTLERVGGGAADRYTPPAPR
jgi:tRNA/tmRNA/rRNA uracil-C5-methylase (TrmA/RlmC/RlmD family)